MKPLLHNDFIATAITAKKKCASHNRAFHEVEFGPFRRLRQMNGTRLKLFQPARRPEQKSSPPWLARTSIEMTDTSVLVVEGSESDDIFLCNGIDDDVRT
ncbi:hypothetical protein GCM10008098_01690 [Rhodanobacter panaciterrae]|uniref:Uncharacterized protein n=1 Tax=Rhodanobacter panaciterrae TaxID=490572 RepID=A0ABQ2ZEQ8_9GAMM|nr:hypothetical protein [Rhodanobacter panaciterrae]GGY14542.1 hypothetical protein GCM10008098_01690 [Rhodanobacter panaciterrae]